MTRSRCVSFQKMQTPLRPGQWLALMLLLVFSTSRGQQNERSDARSRLNVVSSFFTWRNKKQKCKLTEKCVIVKDDLLCGIKLSFFVVLLHMF